MRWLQACHPEIGRVHQEVGVDLQVEQARAANARATAGTKSPSRTQSVSPGRIGTMSTDVSGIGTRLLMFTSWS